MLSRALLCGVLAAIAAGGTLYAQASSPPAPADHSNAYYHFAMGHLYAELAGQYGNRGGELGAHRDSTILSSDHALAQSKNGNAQWGATPP